MSDERLRELYAGVLAAGPPAGRAHAAPGAIAALARREGSEDERLATLDHVMACPECKRDFDLLRAVERAGTESGAAARGWAGRGWRGPLALAAMLMLAVGVSLLVRSPAGDVTRGDDTAVILLQPGPEALIREPVTFAWRPVAGAQRYELEVLDAAGNVAASATTPDTIAAPDAMRALPVGNYRWWVRASTRDARTVRSTLRALQLTAE